MKVLMMKLMKQRTRLTTLLHMMNQTELPIMDTLTEAKQKA